MPKRNNFKLFLASLSLILVSGLSVVGSASAHVLREDHGISGVLHIPPSDEPQAGEETNMYVSFGDKSNKFSLANCNCTMAISQNGKRVANLKAAPQLAGATLASVTSYNFPAVGVYDIVVSGKSTNGSFQSFTLPYVVRVAGDARSNAVAKKQGDNTAMFTISGGVLAGIGIFGYAGMRDGQRYKPTPKRK